MCIVGVFWILQFGKRSYELSLKEKKEEDEEHNAENIENKIRNASMNDDAENLMKKASLKTPLKLKESPINVWDMFTNFDVPLVVYGSSFSTFLHSIADLLLNMVCLTTLRWTLVDVSIATSLGLAANAAAALLTYKRFLKNGKNVFFFNLIANTISWMCVCLLLAISYDVFTNFAVQMVLVTFVAFVNIYSTGAAVACGRLLLFSLVPSHSSSSCEGIRAAFSRIICCVAYFTTALMLTHVASCVHSFVDRNHCVFLYTTQEFILTDSNYIIGVTRLSQR